MSVGLVWAVCHGTGVAGAVTDSLRGLGLVEGGLHGDCDMGIQPMLDEWTVFFTPLTLFPTPSGIGSMWERKMSHTVQ